jgi:hypothetical protein
MPVAARGIEGTSDSALAIFQAGYLLGMAAMFIAPYFSIGNTQTISTPPGGIVRGL